jgi:hypothetical protein
MPILYVQKYYSTEKLYVNHILSSECLCELAVPFTMGITGMIFSQCILWKSSPLCYYNDYVGEELPLSAFCRTSVGEWDAFRSIDMDAEVGSMLFPVLLPT